MWIVLVFTAAQIALAYGLMELMYRDNYYCYGIPYPDGSFEVQCYYIP